MQANSKSKLDCKQIQFILFQNSVFVRNILKYSKRIDNLLVDN